MSKRKRGKALISKWACDGGGSMWVAETAHSLFTSMEFAKVCEAARREFLGLPQVSYRHKGHWYEGAPYQDQASKSS